VSEKPPTIVVVDDTESSRYAVCRVLRQANFEVQEAATGQDALRLAAARPDLVILDIQLPDLNGYEVCQRIKANPATANTPVLHLSASFVESDDRSEGLEGGADGYLTYPLEPRELIATVQALLRIRQAEQVVRAQGELLRVTLSSIGDGVISTDTKGSVAFINAVAQALTGWGEEAVGRPLDEVFHIVNEQTGQALNNPVDQVVSTGKPSYLANPTLLVARDGTRRPIDDSACPMRDAEGQFIGTVLVFRDVTERRRLEAELRRRSDDLAERDRRKDEFLAMLAHELRSPLAPITNSLNYLRIKFAGNSDFAESGALISRQVAHLARLVDDLMDISRITRSKFELRRERVDLVTLMRRAVESARPLLEARQHRLEVNLSNQALALDADPDRLEQVLINLLSNAGKYTPPGGLVRLTGEREGDTAVIRVWDNGIGIRSEMLPRLFEIFEQADRVPGRVSEGLGIGLSLVRGLVEMHGGTVSAHSAGPNQGSEFIVQLPLASRTPAKQAHANPRGTVAPARPLRILEVDDNIDGAESLAMVLRMKGHEVQIAHDGPAALAAAAVFHPEVVLLDIGLPKGMDGYELTRQLRTLPELQNTLFIDVTGYGQEQDRLRSNQAGFAAHLVKPVDLGVLQDLLAQVQTQ
jgi:PAS domain S-box-containing protein